MMFISNVSLGLQNFDTTFFCHSTKYLYHIYRNLRLFFSSSQNQLDTAKFTSDI